MQMYIIYTVHDSQQTCLFLEFLFREEMPVHFNIFECSMLKFDQPTVCGRMMPSEMQHERFLSQPINSHSVFCPCS